MNRTEFLLILIPLVAGLIFLVTSKSFDQFLDKLLHSRTSETILEDSESLSKEASASLNEYSQNEEKVRTVKKKLRKISERKA